MFLLLISQTVQTSFSYIIYQSERKSSVQMDTALRLVLVYIPLIVRKSHVQTQTNNM